MTSIPKDLNLATESPIKTLVVILGPTGIGKTELSLKLAEEFGSPVINADSRQIYRDIPIGTAAPTEEELRRVPHHFVGMLGLEEYYSAAQYEADALKLIEEEFKTHDVLVMSGGSMLYIDAVCKGIDDIPTIDEDTRELMRRRLDEEGLPALAEELKRLDPDYYAVCDPCNTRRVVHALEICHMTGLPYTTFRTGTIKQRPFRILRIGLKRERSELFARIGERVDAMMQQGLLDEVQRVFPLRHCNSLNTVGYKELFKYLDGEWTLDLALEKIKRNTRVYAKKQMTWFAKDETTAWFHPDDVGAIFEFVRKRKYILSKEG